MPKKIKKSIAMKNIKLDMLSAVGEPNTELTWLLTKGKEDKQLKVVIKSKIIENSKITEKLELSEIEKNLKDGEHLVVGVAYPAMKTDYDDNYATEEEVTKAMKTLVSSGDTVDTNHDWEENKEFKIVKHVILEDDADIAGENGEIQELKKGTWITAAVVTGDSWEKVEKGQLNGWSIGGVAEMDKEETFLEKMANKASKMVDRIKKNKKASENKIEKGILVDKNNEDEAIRKICSLWWSLKDIIDYPDDKKQAFKDFKEGITEFSEILSEMENNIDSGVLMKSIAKSKENREEEMSKELLERVEKLEKSLEEKEKEIQKSKDKQEKIEKSKSDKILIQKSKEYAASMGLEFEAEEEDTATDIAKFVLENTNNGNMEGKSDDYIAGTIETLHKSRVEKSKSSKTEEVKIEKNVERKAMGIGDLMKEGEK